MHVFWHDGNSLGVDGAKVGVLEESNHVGLSSLLEGKDGRGLESEVSLEVGSDFSDESLERKLSDKELSGFLVLSDHSEGDGSWSESVWFLDTTSSGSGFTGCLSGEGFLGSLGGGGFSSGLFGTGHSFTVGV